MRPLAAFLLVFAACTGDGTNSRTNPDTGPIEAPFPDEDGGPAGDAGPGADSGPVDSGPPPCGFHTDCDSDEWCDDQTGACHVAHVCDDDSICNFYAVDQQDARYAYCGTFEYDGCKCVGGVCRPRVQFCHRCTQPSDCPSSFVSQCVADRPAGVNTFCMPTTQNNCTAVVGFTYPSSGNICRPGTLSGTCDGFAPCDTTNPCELDGARPICNANHVCTPACTAPEDCSSIHVCNLRTDLLATTRNSGKGQCGDACTDTVQCARYGTGLTCMRDIGVNTGPKRCRITGCLEDQECPAPDRDGEYCNLATHACVHAGCQTHDDCALSAGGKMQKCNASRQCEEATCDEAGGNVSCPNTGEFCCGVDGGIACAPADKGKCLKASNTTFCQDCKHDQGDAPDHAKCSAAPNMCDIAIGSGTWACSVPCETSQQCPSGWGCNFFRKRICIDNTFCGSSAADGGPGDCNTDKQQCDCRNGATCPPGFTCSELGGCVTKACVPQECPIP